MGLYSEKIDGLIDLALADGELTEKERVILLRKAAAEGIDLDEFEMVLEARLYEAKKSAKAEAAAQPAQPTPVPPVPPVAAPQPTVAPNSQKFGNIYKCPACGAIVTTGSAVCTECGFAFNNVAGKSAMDTLQERLAEIDKKYDRLKQQKGKGFLSSLLDDDDYEMDGKKAAEKMSVIRMLNVPNTRAEILGLLTALQPICNPKGCKSGWSDMKEREDLSLAYWDLFNVCINKARISFANDKAFEPYFKFYEEKTAKKGLFSSLFGK